jgi:hypothetical protein
MKTGDETINYSNLFWIGITKYFPKDKVEKIVCKDDNKIIIENASLSNIPPIKCVCEVAEKRLSSRSLSSAWNITYVDQGHLEYLNTCYPSKKEQNRKFFVTIPEREISSRSYLGFEIISKGDLAISLWDERFRAFFLGSSRISEKLKGMVDWSNGIRTDKAFPLLEQALDSRDEKMQQVALYAYSFYPDELTKELKEKLRLFASQEKFPDYLYAAYSLAASHWRGMLSRVSIRTFASSFSTSGFGALNVRNTSCPSFLFLKKCSYLVRSFLTTKSSTSLPSESHICSSQPRCEKT